MTGGTFRVNLGKRGKKPRAFQMIGDNEIVNAGAEDFRRNVVIVVLFNIFPLALVLTGEWRPFDVMAFYWVEVIAAGMLALLRLGITLLRDIGGKKWGAAASHAASLVALPLHFGFFIVMTCFLIGSFLPEGTPTRKLTGPLVPMEMVLENIDFWKWFMIVMAWEAALFAYRATQGTARGFIASSAVGDAYARLFILFGSGFFGLLVAMALDARIAGAVLLVAVKTLVSVGILYAKFKYPQEAPQT